MTWRNGWAYGYTPSCILALLGIDQIILIELNHRLCFDMLQTTWNRSTVDSLVTTRQRTVSTSAEYSQHFTGENGDQHTLIAQFSGRDNDRLNKPRICVIVPEEVSRMPPHPWQTGGNTNTRESECAADQCSRHDNNWNRASLAEVLVAKNFRDHIAPANSLLGCSASSSVGGTGHQWHCRGICDPAHYEQSNNL